MKALIALEELIKQDEKRISLAKKQLSEHEAGNIKLSFLERTSTENNLEESQANLAKHTELLNIMKQQDLAELEEKERLQEEIRKKNYYKNQRLRIKRKKEMANDVKLEVLHILDELAVETEISDENLFEMATISMQMQLVMHEEVHQEFLDISKDWESLIKSIKEPNISDLQLLNKRIPIIILHFATLSKNIKENLEEEKKDTFKGFPKYSDWWFEELWVSHQAYFGLYKWKSIVYNLCYTTEQKLSWEQLFESWVFAKKIIKQKELQGFEYNYAFDTLLKKYAEFEEELDIKNIQSMEKIVEEITKKENFLTYKPEHNIKTAYYEFKIKKESEKSKK